MSKILIAAAASTLLLPLAAHAQNIEVGARVSTLGAGAEIGANVNPHLRIRGIVNGWDHNHDNTSDNIRYNGKIKLASAGVQLDYRPVENGSFYVTAASTAIPTRSTKPRPRRRIPASAPSPIRRPKIGTLDARGHFKRSAPYLGLGWGLSDGRPGCRSISKPAPISRVMPT
ncbi:MAG: hypothetical protein WDN06_19515 [Asticcacaulis sp.]